MSSQSQADLGSRLQHSKDLTEIIRAKFTALIYPFDTDEKNKQNEEELRTDSLKTLRNNASTRLKDLAAKHSAYEVQRAIILIIKWAINKRASHKKFV